tara:strand:- start:10431 stop:11201 length:771 start_codon:yes stop_codon:yes gene_type:complete
MNLNDYLGVFEYINDMQNVRVDDILSRTETIIFGGIQSFIIFLVWAAIYTIIILLRNQQEIQSAMIEAQILLLTNQISPHFLFNVLNSIRALIYEDVDLAAQSITKLSNLLRSNMMSTVNNYSTLKQEVDICNEYLGLCKIRFGDRLETIYQLEGDLSAYFLPTLTLLTLVENAIKNGVEVSMGTSTVKINIDCTNQEHAFIQVANSLGEDKSAMESTKLGIYNVKKRLKLMPKKNSIEMHKNNDQFSVEIKIERN